MKQQTRCNVFDIINLLVVGWFFYEAARDGQFWMAMKGFAILVMGFLVLFVIEVFLMRRKSEAWMRGYHLALGAVLSISLVTWIWIGAQRQMTPGSEQATPAAVQGKASQSEQGFIT